MKKRGTKPVALFTCISMIFLFISCNPQTEEPGPPPIRPIRTIQIGDVSADRERSFSGIARASVETRLSFRVGGKIDRLPVKIGMKMAEGDLIAGLDPTDYKLTLRQAEARLAQARAQYIRAKADYDRDRQLYEAGDISRSQLDRSLAAYQSGKAQVSAAREAVRLAEQQLKYTTLFAPMSGTVASVPAEVHETVMAGMPVATMTSGGDMEMAVGVPESLIAQIHPDAPARIVFDTIADKEFQAKVIEVGVEATDSTAYPVRLRILEKDDRLRPGMVGEAILSFRASEQFITIPLVAVVSTPDGTRYVWLWQPDKGSVTRRDVTVGALTSAGLQIISGLAPGDIIAVRGVHRLTEGMKVKLMPPTRATTEEEAAS